VLRRSRAAVRSCCPLDVASRAVGAPIAPSVARLTVVGVPLAADHADAQGRWFWYRRSSADQSLLMSFSAANGASASDAKSSGVTTLRTLSPPTHSPIRTLGIMATRQCPGLRRYVTIENSRDIRHDAPRSLACYGAMSTICCADHAGRVGRYGLAHLSISASSSSAISTYSSTIRS